MDEASFLFSCLLLFAISRRSKLKKKKFDLSIELKAWREFSKIKQGDQFLEAMKDGSIDRSTLRIPYPYEEKHLDSWLEFSKNLETKWFIEIEGEFVGSMGAELVTAPGREHYYGVGYFIAPKFWGKGIATEALRKAILLLQETCPGCKYLEAYTYVPNKASQRVLENNGFQKLAFLPHHFIKKGQIYDAVYFSRPLFL